MRLRLRHPDLRSQLTMRPALTTLPRFAVGRPRACLSDQQRPHLRAVRQRPARARRIRKPRQPVTHKPRPPLRDRRVRATQLLADPRHRMTVGGAQHDPRTLDHPHLRTRRGHDPRQRTALLVDQHDRWRSRHRTSILADTSTWTSRRYPRHLPKISEIAGGTTSARAMCHAGRHQPTSPRCSIKRTHYPKFSCRDR